MLFINQNNVSDIRRGLEKYTNSTKNITRGLRHLLMPFFHVVDNVGQEVLILRTLLDQVMDSIDGRFLPKDNKSVEVMLMYWGLCHVNQYRKHAELYWPSFKDNFSMTLGITSTPSFYFVFPSNYQDLMGRDKMELAQAIDDAVFCYSGFMGSKLEQLMKHRKSLGISDEDIRRYAENYLKTGEISLE